MTLITLLLPALIPLTTDNNSTAPIDRHALVTRHNVTLTAYDDERPVQVGNGEFAFGMDITGLQSFTPFNTMSHWGWNSHPLPAGMSVDQFQGQVWDTHGRPVRYPMPDPNHPGLSDWLAADPHRINLGRVGLQLTKPDGTFGGQEDIKNPVQKLDLWTGIVTSRFDFDGLPVTVTTACHPDVDSIAVKVDSPLVSAGRVHVFFDCPADNGLQFANYVGDSSLPGRFEMLGEAKSNRADFIRHLDDNPYYMSLTWQGSVDLHQLKETTLPPIEIVKAEYGAGDKWLDVTQTAKQSVHNGRLSIHVNNQFGSDPAPGVGKVLRVVYSVNGSQQVAIARENEDMNVDANSGLHRLTMKSTDGSHVLAFTCAFSPKPPKALPNASQTIDASAKAWPKYWKSGGAVDLSGSTDPRWKELERRLVLSQYLMKVNEAGSLPPQESGLVNNGWFGRFHLEMYWWHAAHWALWNRWPELDKSLGFYSWLLPIAEKTASGEGYLGARWPKCIGPNGREWPHEIHALLLWQQPHPIFFAELDYRAHPTKATLEKWKPIVEATAEFLSSYAFYDKSKRQYVLGPPLIVASENNDAKTTQNPTYELGYWRFGLRTAQMWRTRLGLKPNPIWNRVLKGLSPLPEQDGLYVLYEGVKDMWTKFNFEHPALTATYGILPGDGVDKEAMRKTLHKILSVWNFDRTWGWDYPMMAMCAARLGEPEQAVDFLLTDKPGFQFDARGLATGGPFPYFPSNGGLLYAVAMMAAGWDGAKKGSAPGFPADGRWKVRYEGLSKAP